MIDQAFLPDFSEFYRKDELSDVNVVLEQDEDAAHSGSRVGEKRKAPEADGDEGNVQRSTVPGHSMVLVAFSTFFKTKVRQHHIMQFGTSWSFNATSIMLPTAAWH
jgi:hypothetical protein